MLQSSCSLEPWLRRYLILNKFIHAARVIVLRNRLLKNLEKLKKLDKDEIVKFNVCPKVYNVSYSKIFEKFLWHFTTLNKIYARSLFQIFFLLCYQQNNKNTLNTQHSLDHITGNQKLQVHTIQSRAFIIFMLSF